MTDLDASASNSGTAPAAQTEIAGDPVPIMAPLAGDPAMLGLPVFIVGSVALGLVLVGVVPASAVGASLPIILAATSIGLFIATIWAAAIGQSAVASIFGIFAGFWLSYAVLVLGLIRGWFGITLLAVNSTQELFLISWLVIITVLTLATLRLPLAFTLIFLLVDVALLLVLLGTEEASTGLLKAGGYVVLVFAAVGAYVFYGAASLATGGSKGVPLGKPIQH
jgi:succinate-acetate transporter protein